MGGTWGPRGPSATSAASGQVVVLCPVVYSSLWTSCRIIIRVITIKILSSS